MNKPIIFTSRDNSQHMQSLIIILSAKTVHLALLGVLAQTDVYLKPIDICKRVHTHWCFCLDQKCIFEACLSIIPTYVVSLIMEQFAQHKLNSFPKN